jgi:NADH dehydrogenase FAD-containing subunit
MRLLLITIPILLSTTECHALSASGIKPKPIRTVAIVGSGIAGLTLAHALENSFNLLSYGDGQSIHVTMYDARSSLNYNTGAGVQLTGGTSSGLSVS